MWQKGSTYYRKESAAFLPHELNANVYLFIYLFNLSKNRKGAPTEPKLQ
jgi:hypothetical protein